LMVSCKKKEDTAPAPATTTIPANGWILGTTTYSSVVVGRSGPDVITAMDAMPAGGAITANTFNVFFSAFPTASGTFTIVQYPSASPLTASQIGVTAGLYATSTSYASTGTDGISATVTVTGGKLKIEVPEVWVKKTGTGATDSLKITGTILEQ
jgi:hypothetical protein